MMKVKDKNFVEMLSKEDISSIVDRLAASLNADMAGKNPYFLVMMNGAVFFATDLLRRITIPCGLAFVKYTSYVGMNSTGKVTAVLPVPADVKGRNVVVVEDIVDTGETMKAFLTEVQRYAPESVRIVSFLAKPAAMKHPLLIDYVGKEIGNEFVLGYGLDYDGLGRNVPELLVYDGK
ncbi:MAG: hypoxanthine phosphoribosyltransferase [Paludibacteraceae bacterium]|nr:hypoxanthine phosphoribosyltransferase [Paludibacteraceae bacterium]